MPEELNDDVGSLDMSPDGAIDEVSNPGQVESWLMFLGRQ
jgi:hypothetical protein